MGVTLITKNGNITLTKPTGTGGGTVDLSNYYTKQQIDKMLEEVDGDIEQLFNMLEVDYATIALVEEKIAAIPSPDMSNYATKDEIPDVSKFITSIPTQYVTENELENTLNDKGYLTEHQDLSDYATKSEIAGYQTEEQVNALIAAAMSELVDGDEVSY